MLLLPISHVQEIFLSLFSQKNSPTAFGTKIGCGFFLRSQSQMASFVASVTFSTFIGLEDTSFAFLLAVGYNLVK